MAVLKCKMCGGDLALTAGSRVAECLYCGTKQTVPFADSEKKITLFARAGRLLRACEFDKAAGIFESIVAEFPEEAEAYWGLILCRFGIEYVDDPATGKKVPTCHRSGSESVFDDPDYEQTYENSGPEERKLYREEAKKIEELRESIIEVSRKEEPYDVFICYKETAEDGQRTMDSVLAQDIYDKLTDAGYRVFFSRITLEDKLGTEYEPYIFAALNSAKIMLVFGTDYDNFNAVWVKNEWSRFLKLMEKDKEKRLIPCYRDIDAYDMPKEFAKLQAQDMGKVGADQDLIRAIKKLLPKDGALKVNVQEYQTAEVTYKKAASEKEKRRNGSVMISKLQLVPSNSPNIAFPAGSPTTRVDISRYSHISMQMMLWRRIGYSGTAAFNFSVFNSREEWITNLTEEINVLPQYDRFAKVLIIKGGDGSRLETGKYRLEGWINDSRVEELWFEIFDSSEEQPVPSLNDSQLRKILLKNRAEAQKNKNKVEKQLGKRGRLTPQKITELNSELNRLNQQLSIIESRLASLGK